MPSFETEAIPPVRLRILRAAGVLAIWVLPSLPYFLGFARCPTAFYLHHPCPGCGMSRAMSLLLHGDPGASIAMHPLAVPTALVQAALAASSVIVTLERGTPFDLWKTRYGRASVYAVVVVFTLVLLLWIARWFGFAGGPVSV